MPRRSSFPWELFEALSNARGVTGDEAPVRRVLKEFLRPHVDGWTVDAMGSIDQLLRVAAAGHDGAREDG